MKRAFVVIALLLVVVVSAFALDATVTWSWSLIDRDVNYFRYQLDGEDSAKWIVVDSSVLNASFNLDVSVEHTLYLQQSYDGSNWSLSSYTVSEAVAEPKEEVAEPVAPVEPVAEVAEVAPVAQVAAEPVAEAPVSEEPVVTEEVVEEVVEEEPVEVVVVVEEVASVELAEPAMPAEPVETPVEDVVPATPVEEVKPVEEIVSESVAEVTKKSAKSIVNLGAVYGNNIPFDANGHLVGVSLGYTYLFGTKSAFSFGAKAQATVYTPLDSIKNFATDNLSAVANVLFVADYAASWGDAYLGVGGGIWAPIKSIESFLVGVSAQLGARVQLYKAFGAGVEVDGCYYLYPSTADRIDINARLYLSLAF